MFRNKDNMIIKNIINLIMFEKYFQGLPHLLQKCHYHIITLILYFMTTTEIFIFSAFLSFFSLRRIYLIALMINNNAKIRLKLLNENIIALKYIFYFL